MQLRPTLTTKHLQKRKFLLLFKSAKANQAAQKIKLLTALLIGFVLFGNKSFCQNDGGIEATKLFALAGSTLITASNPEAAPLAIDAIAKVPATPLVQEPQEILGLRKIKNIITLRLFEEIPEIIPSDFTIDVDLEIKYGASETSTLSTINQTLTIDYHKGSGAKYKAKNYFSFDGAGYVSVKVLNITPQTSGSFDLKKMLILENEMRITRYYQLASNAQIQNPRPSIEQPYTDELAVTWDPAIDLGSTHTQLEWAWIEGDFASDYNDANNSPNYDKIFNNNATRIDLPATRNSYRIPLLYGGPGKLYYRVRPVNQKENDRADGLWTNAPAYSFGGHNQDLNWQSSATYAEEGKRKIVVQYFDGSLRSRQTVTKDNVTNTVVTAETLYDGQGRPAIQILPAPGTIKAISYQPGLNLFKANSTLGIVNDQVMTKDPADYFDLQPANTTTSITPELNTLTGASNYYSASNSEKNNGVNKNIPDAQGYPYTVTRYTPDATVRIMSQSGVGPTMKMGSGHETKYYYGTPAQEELDALFGTEVGNYTHYFKNMVKDANGQMSVSYVDMHGRTIATALAGDAAMRTPNMVPLDINNASLYPNQQGTQIKRNLLNGNTNVVKGNSVESATTLLVPDDNSYHFTYKLTPEALGLTVNNASLCYDCMYNLEISITDESGEQLPIVKKYNNISLSADDNCSTTIEGLKDESNNPVVNNEFSFDQPLTAGSYIIRKTLTVSESSIEKYKQEYIAKALITTEEELINTIYAEMLLTSDCDNPPADACVACNNALGNFETFKSNYLLTAPGTPLSEIQKIFDEEKLNCDRLCNKTSQVVNNIRELMIADMMVGGQYSRTPDEAGTIGTMYNQYNIDPATNPAGTDPELAKDLLPQHPEYQRLLYAESAPMKNVYDWMTTFNNTATYADAASAGKQYVPNTTSVDPFYTTVGAGYKGAMDVKIGNYVQGLTMWQFAYGNAMCRDIVDPVARKDCYQNAAPYSPYSSLSAANQDKVWNEFKKLYTTERNNHVNDHIAVTKPLSNAQALVDQGYILHFPNNNTQLAQQFDHNSETGSDWSWFPPAADGNLNPNFTGTTAADVYAGRCDSYIAQWKQTLLECPALAERTDRDAIITQITTAMKQICIASSNEANPYGASNVSPGTPGVPYSSFEEAINAILIEKEIPRTNLCNPYVIEWPKPYSSGPNMTANYIAVVEKCNCDQLSKLKSDAQTAGFDPNSYASFSQYLTNTYGETITQPLYNAMMENCAKLGTTSCRDLGHEGTECLTRECIEVGHAFVLTDPQPMPDFLKCGFTNNINCLTCAQLSQYITDLKAYFGAAYDPQPRFTGSDLTAKNIQDNILFAQYVNYKTGFSYLWTDYATKAKNSNCNLDEYTANATATQTVICRDKKPITDPTDLITEDNACQHVRDLATYKAQEILKQRRQTLIEEFEKAYRAKCLNNGYENFTVTYTPKEYHYTLYYYDMAGNLVKTVPPKGVRPDYRETEFLSKVRDERNKMLAGLPWTPKVPGHVLVTDYRYNSLNQVIAQNTPDAGMSKFWYDRLGRLVVSQNAKQAAAANSPEGGATRRYSYTIYDELGRIKEVGQKPQARAMNQDISQNKLSITDLEDWISEGTKEQITRTVYDLAYGADGNPPQNILDGLMTQQNLRNRLSYTMTLSSAADPSAYHSATFYTYDVHGNVDALVQDYKGVTEMVNAQHRFTLITYEYDLISGKVNGVNYRPGKSDAFYHKYSYDAENRLTLVETSRDKLVWEQDASYQYYKHGPLARTELGKLRVQGIDYAYTLQGWLKGVNAASSVAGSNGECMTGTAIDDLVVSSRTGNTPAVYTARNTITFAPEFGSGDGDAFETNIDPNLPACTPDNSSTVPLTAWDEVYPATRDAYNFSLHYFNNDYAPIGDNAPGFVPVLGVGSTNAKPLYNGNIAAMAVSISKLSPMVYNYRYDQLNRLVSMDAYSGLTPTSFTPTHLADHKETITYDPNGNILTYFRNGTTTGGKSEVMDDMTYQYPRLPNGDPINNRLRYVGDITSAYTEDIKSQTTLNRQAIFSENLEEQKGATGDNYQYDEIGNLIYDRSENITSIKWTVYGKIESITKNGNAISYTYDASGNRITKTAGGKTTIYVRDASGNVMSVYEYAATTFKQKEVHLYGSSRIGILNEITTPTVDVTNGGLAAKLTVFTRGERMFELSNHLDNVLATVSDKKIAHDAGNGAIDYYLADVMSANDYAPFGMQMVGRKWNSASYRYGFNGKENDNEVKGEGNEQDYGMRIYDPRLGKFLSVDPLTSNYPGWSPYPFAMNRPIDGIDLDGLEWAPVFAKNDTKHTDPIDYKWVGYNNDGTPKKGSDGIGFVVKSDGTVWSFTSDPKTLSGHVRVSYLDKKEIKYPQGPDKSPLFEYNIDIKQSPLAETFSAKGNISNEHGISKDIDLTPTVWDKPTGNYFFNQLKEKTGLGVPSTSITAVYPEAAILLPGPKLGIGAKIASRIGELEIPVYRVFGGSSRVFGESWTFVNPRLYGSFYRNFAGLPNWNKGSFMVKGTVKLSEINSFRMALPLHGNIGRFAPEFVIKNAENKVLLKSFRVTNF